MNITVVSPQLTLPRISDGIDYGRERKLLARRGPKVLFWVPGGMVYYAIGRTKYYQGYLVCQVDGNLSSGHSLYPADCEGKTRLGEILKTETCRTFIKKYFMRAPKWLAMLHARQTILIE